MKKRARKKRVTRILEKYEPSFENMFAPALEIVEEFNPSEHRTNVAKITNNLEKQFDNAQNTEQFGTAFIELFANMDFERHISELNQRNKKEVAEHTKRDERFGELYRLVYEAEKICPNVASVLFLQSNPLEIIPRSLEPYDLMQEFQSQKGEIASRTAVRIYREVAELLYNDYLKVVYSLVQVLEKKKTIRLADTFGNMARQLSIKLEKLGYKNLVEPDASWMRNATCHAQWFYKPEKGKTVLWNQKKEEREFTPDELAGKANDMYTMVVENYLPLVWIYLGNQICSKEWAAAFKYAQANLTAIIGGDQQKADYVNGMLEAEFAKLKMLEFK